MWIQLILLAAIVGVALVLNRSTADARHQAIRRLLLMLFVAGAAASSTRCWPSASNVTTYVAPAPTA